MSDFQQEQQQRQQQQGKDSKKRGMKPRSQRQRKKNKSMRHALEDVEYKSQVQQLELDGNPILSATGERTWIRTVEPYPYTFTTFAKARWVGRTIMDIYCTEFGSYPPQYYQEAILQGRILVSDKVVPLDYKVKGSDVLMHTVHRHEPGVAVTSHQPPYLHIIHDSDSVLVVDKPGTLPIHACGGYHVQSLMNILEPNFGGKLYTIHRLDRLTSGLVILGKTSRVAQEWGKAIMHRNCEKVYLARVSGKFPLNCPETLRDKTLPLTAIPDHGEFIENRISDKEVADDASTSRKRNAYGYWITNRKDEYQIEATLDKVNLSAQSADQWLDNGASDDGLWLHLACPTRISKPKDGICEAGPFDDLEDSEYLKTVKPAETSFGVVDYDMASDSTLLICRPKTGRTHQIRLHLQHLGHPIANDPNYGGDIWYANAKGQEASRVAQERLDRITASNQENKEISSLPVVGPSTATIDVPATETEIQQGISGAMQGDGESIHEFIKRTCVWCARSRNTIGGTPRDALEFLIRSPGIWLHALQYTFVEDSDSPSTSSKTFRAPLPEWATFKTNSGQ